MISISNPRFFGPVSADDAEKLTDLILDGPHIQELLMRFAQGEVEPQELSYEIQCLYECEETRVQNDAQDGLFLRKEMREAVLV